MDVTAAWEVVEAAAVLVLATEVVLAAELEEETVVTSAAFISILPLASYLEGCGRLLAASNDREIRPMDVETQAANVVGLGGIKTDIWVVVGCFHG